MIGHYELVCTQKKNSVLKYAWCHKKLERRSALTYRENIEKMLGKISMVHGPFSEEENVRNIKKNWRIVTVLLSTYELFIPYYHTVNSGVVTYINTFEPNLNGHDLWL